MKFHTILVQIKTAYQLFTYFIRTCFLKPNNALTLFAALLHLKLVYAMCLSDVVTMSVSMKYFSMMSLMGNFFSQ